MEVTTVITVVMCLGTYEHLMVLLDKNTERENEKVKTFRFYHKIDTLLSASLPKPLVKASQ